MGRLTGAFPFAASVSTAGRTIGAIASFDIDNNRTDCVSFVSDCTRLHIGPYPIIHHEMRPHA